MSQETFDGLDIEQFGGKFGGTFPLDENFPMDHEVAFLVVGRVTGANVSNTRQGSLKRVNTFEVLEVAVTGNTPKSRRMVAATEQAKGQLTITGDGEYDDRPGDEDESRVFSRPESSNNDRSSAPVSAGGGTGGFTRKEFLDESGWS